jgi:glycosyltransferase involved in cell wall biosynthesis
MRLLVLFRSKVLHDQGTPLRARNLAQSLAQLPGVDVLLLSRDESTAVQQTLAISHQSLHEETADVNQLRHCIDRFQPDLLYGQTHKGLTALGSLPDWPGRPRLVADLHGDRASQQLERTEQSWLWRRYWSWRAAYEERKYAPRMDGFTVVSHPLAQRAAAYQKPTLVLWGGVDLAQFRPSPPRPADGRIQVAYAGNFRPYQGVSTLLQAANRLVAAGEPFHFTLIGNIAAFPEQAALAHALGDNVTLPGLLPFAEIPSRLGQADILVTPRADGRSAHYNYPSKLSEQLALGKAVIVTDVGEAGQLAQHGKTALVIPPGSVEAMVEALLKLKDHTLRQQLGQAARAFAEENLAWPLLATRLRSFFQSLTYPGANPTAPMSIRAGG